MIDYTLRCDCNWERSEGTLAAAKRLAKNHFNNPAECSGKEVYIDQYDSEGGDMGGGELTGKYWIVKR